MEVHLDIVKPLLIFGNVCTRSVTQEMAPELGIYLMGCTLTLLRNLE